MATRGRKKGVLKTPGSGRKKGTPNKLTVQVKDAIQNAFSTVGGEKYLVKVAKEDPRTFCALLGKVLPTQLEGDLGLTVKTHEEALAEIEKATLAAQSARKPNGKARPAHV